MNVSKPSLEKITPNFGSSYSIKQYVGPPDKRHPFWHFHPEVELTYVRGGNGRRHVGSHMSMFRNGLLIFLGSNLPHFPFTDELTGNKTKTVIQMKEDFLGNAFLDIPEIGAIRQLFDLGKAGICYYGVTKRKIGARIEALPQLRGFPRLLELLDILYELSISEDGQLLNADGFSMEIDMQDNARINDIYDFVDKNYKRQITLTEIADKSSMTVPAFCRYFKKVSKKTFIQFVNEYRIVKSCKLISLGNHSIGEISYETGFNSISQFNRLFKSVTGQSPTEYRKELKQLLISGQSHQNSMME
jgi:AraC-like DNA-binding protein